MHKVVCSTPFSRHTRQLQKVIPVSLSPILKSTSKAEECSSKNQLRNNLHNPQANCTVADKPIMLKQTRVQTISAKLESSLDTTSEMVIDDSDVEFEEEKRPKKYVKKKNASVQNVKNPIQKSKGVPPSSSKPVENAVGAPQEAALKRPLFDFMIPSKRPRIIIPEEYKDFDFFEDYDPISPPKTQVPSRFPKSNELENTYKQKLAEASNKAASKTVENSQKRHINIPTYDVEDGSAVPQSSKLVPCPYNNKEEESVGEVVNEVLSSESSQKKSVLKEKRKRVNPKKPAVPVKKAPVQRKDDTTVEAPVESPRRRSPRTTSGQSVLQKQTIAAKMAKAKIKSEKLTVNATTVTADSESESTADSESESTADSESESTDQEVQVATKKPDSIDGRKLVANISMNDIPVPPNDIVCNPQDPQEDSKKVSRETKKVTRPSRTIAAKEKILTKKTPSAQNVESAANDTGAVRRSKRTRIKPINFWEGQKHAYIETTLGAEQIESGLNNKQLTQKGQQPIPKNKQPIPNDKQPGLVEKQPIAKEKQTISKEKQPMPKEKQPIAKEKQPIAKEKQPIAKEKQPIAKEKQPIAKEKQPIAKEKQPIPKEKQPSIVKPIPKDKQPISQDKQPISQDKQLIPKDSQPILLEKQSTRKEKPKSKATAKEDVCVVSEIMKLMDIPLDSLTSQDEGCEREIELPELIKMKLSLNASKPEALTEIAIASEMRHMETLSKFEGTARVDNNVRVTKTLQSPFISCGYLRMNQGASKGLQRTTSKTVTVFSVLTSSTLEININGDKRNIGMGQHFWIPPEVLYDLKNMSATPVLLQYCVFNIVEARNMFGC